MTYISRKQWGAQPATGRTAWQRGQPTSWTLHWEGAFCPQDRDRAYYDQRVRNIQNAHLHHPEGYWDIAYNFIVSPIGDIYEGRGWNNQSGAQRSGNSKSIAVMTLGGPGQDFTAKAQNANKWLIDQKPMPAHPHYFWTGTACPGPNIVAWINLGLPAGKKCYCPKAAPPPPPPPPPKPAARTFPVGPTLRQGHKNSSVTTLQHRLNLVTGARLVVDGDFGPATHKAVTNFQRYFKLTVDGIVGPQTWGALNYFYALKGGR